MAEQNDQNEVVEVRKTMYRRTNDLRDACRDLDKRLDQLTHDVERAKEPSMTVIACAVVGATSLGVVAVTLIVAAVNG